MTTLTVQTLGRRLKKRRQNRGVREVASEIGISAATLSRLENGHIPDLETFKKVCQWLEIDPAEVLGLGKRSGKATEAPIRASVHFRKKKTLNPNTAKALANMILAAQRAMKTESEL